MSIIELLGAFFSIIAALLISKATNESIYRANILFFISNILLLTFFFINGLIPLIIQMTLFFSTAVLGILRLSKNKERDQKIIIFLLSIYFITFGLYIYTTGINNFSFHISIFDGIASTMAIIGAFLLPYDDFVKRNIAYVLFLLADILFIYVGYTNGFYFFMIQSIFYIFTSSFGLLNNMKIHKTKLQAI